MIGFTKRLLIPCLLLLAIIGSPANTLAAPAPPPPGATFQVLETRAGEFMATTACGVFELPAGATAWNKIPGLDQRVPDVARLGGNALLAIALVGDAAGNVRPALFRREAGGVWEQLAQAPSDPASLATNEAGTRAYLRTGFGPSRLWRSDDQGRTWQQVYQSQGQDVILDVAVAGAFSGRQDMVVAVYRGNQDEPRSVIRSLDNGATWKVIPEAAASTNDARLFVDYESTRVYVASSGANGMHLSRLTDSSERMEAVDLPEGWSGLPYFPTAVAAFRSSVVLSINVSTNQSTVIGAQQGAARSYSPYDQGLRSGIWDLAYSRPSGEPAPEPVLLAATDDGIYQRATGAPSWTRWASQPSGCAETPPSSDPFAPVPRRQNTREMIYFGETQHTLSHEFKVFWEQHGRLPIFGYPLSEEFPERNIDLERVFTTQYLERERFEFHPENDAPYRVLLGRLGDELLKRQGRDWRTEDDLNNPFPNTGCTGFDVGGERRQICGPFQDYWQTHGLNIGGQTGTSSYQESLALFGLPLTGVRMETNQAGNSVLTQWFERARFEWHPANPEPYKVLLGLLGNEITNRPR